MKSVEFLASKKLLQFDAGSSDSLAGSVRDLGSAPDLRVSAWKEEFDSCRCHMRSIGLTSVLRFGNFASRKLRRIVRRRLVSDSNWNEAEHASLASCRANVAAT